MKIGICNTAYFSQELGAVDYKRMREQGFECSDYQQFASVESALYQMKEADFEGELMAQRQAAWENGISFSQVHAPFTSTGETEEERRMLMECTLKAVRGAQLLGSKYLVVHTIRPHRWDEKGDPEETLRINREYFEKLCRYAEERGVCICAENLPYANHSLAGVPELVKFVDAVGMPNLFVCFDTGHSNVCGENMKEMLQLCGSRLKVFHIHDNIGPEKGDLHLLPYTGTVDWQGFQEGIRAIGFDGCLSLETQVRLDCPELIRERLMKSLSDLLRSWC